MDTTVNNVTNVNQKNDVYISSSTNESLRLSAEVINTYKQKVSYLKSQSYWIGNIPRKDVVENLYTLAKEGKITPDVWNEYGDSTKPWEKQSSQIKAAKATKIDGEKIVNKKSVNHVVENSKNIESCSDNNQENSLKHENQDSLYTFYAIKKGDTLSKIANDHGIELRELIKLNKKTIKNPHKISVGQIIKLPQNTNQKNTTEKLVQSAKTESKSDASITQNNPIGKSQGQMPSPSVFKIEREENCSNKNVEVSTSDEELMEGENWHVVKKGETITFIAKMYNIPPAKLLWDNRIRIEGTKVKEGDSLVISRKELSQSEKIQADIYYSNAVRLENILIHPEMRRLAPQLIKIFEENGYLVEIYSDFRTFERQAELYRKNKWPAAPPGYSDHNWGLAVDVRLYKKSRDGYFVSIPTEKIPSEMAKNPHIEKKLKENGLLWEGPRDPMHFSVGTIERDYDKLIAKRQEAINLIGAKDGNLSNEQQRIVIYYVWSYMADPSLSSHQRLELAKKKVNTENNPSSF